MSKDSGHQFDDPNEEIFTRIGTRRLGDQSQESINRIRGRLWFLYFNKNRKLFFKLAVAASVLLVVGYFAFGRDGTTNYPIALKYEIQAVDTDLHTSILSPLMGGNQADKVELQLPDAARLAYEKDEFESAEILFDELRHLSPHEPYYDLFYAHCLLRTGKPLAAIEFFTRGYKQVSGNETMVGCV